MNIEVYKNDIKNQASEGKESRRSSNKTIALLSSVIMMHLKTSSSSPTLLGTVYAAEGIQDYDIRVRMTKAMTRCGKLGHMFDSPELGP